jgi:hypothetical protein
MGRHAVCSGESFGWPASRGLHGDHYGKGNRRGDVGFVRVRDTALGGAWLRCARDHEVRDDTRLAAWAEWSTRLVSLLGWCGIVGMGGRLGC